MSPPININSFSNQNISVDPAVTRYVPEDVLNIHLDDIQKQIDATVNEQLRRAWRESYFRSGVWGNDALQ